MPPAGGPPVMQDAELCDAWKGYHEAEARELGYARLLTSCCIFSRTLQATAIPTAHASDFVLAKEAQLIPSPRSPPSLQLGQQP